MAEAGVSTAPIPRDLPCDAGWQIRLARRWTDTAAAAFAEYGGDDDAHRHP
jgi:hypothetical protein